MYKRIVPILLLACALPAWSAAPALTLAVERVDGVDGGKVYQITSSGTVAAPPAAVWRILSDYNRMAEYVPDLRSARVLSRNGANIVVEQQGGVRLLFMTRPIRLVVQVHEQRPATSTSAWSKAT
jgi:uncharacterized protein involved in type VI secretion and phage assembly